MRFIREIYSEKQAQRRPVISFELYPPKTAEGDRALFEKTLPAMAALRPDFCSVTYGAGGSTREKTLTIVDRMQRALGLIGLAHLTCVGSTREQMKEVIGQIKALGIKNILALRGDPPGGVGEFEMTPGGFEFSYQLIEFIRQQGDFSIGTAGFPEGHIACKEGKLVDWQRLKAKIETGADFVLTQLFFDTNDFLLFRDHMTRQLGVKVPIVPGVIPMLGAGQTKRFAAMCGARLPTALVARLDQLGDDDAATTEFGIDYATAQCQQLLREGVPGLHLYTLNKAHSISRIMQNLRLA